MKPSIIKNLKGGIFFFLLTTYWFGNCQEGPSKLDSQRKKVEIAMDSLNKQWDKEIPMIKTIYLEMDDKFIIHENKKMTLDEFTPWFEDRILAQYHSDTSLLVHIDISYAVNVKHEFYEKVTIIIESKFSKIWEKISENIFEEPFRDLSNQSKEIVKRNYPMIIITNNPYEDFDKH